MANMYFDFRGDSMKRQIIIRVLDDLCFVEDEDTNTIISTLPVNKNNKFKLVSGVVNLLLKMDAEYSIIYE